MAQPTEKLSDEGSSQLAADELYVLKHMIDSQTNGILEVLDDHRPKLPNGKRMRARVFKDLIKCLRLRDIVGKLWTDGFLCRAWHHSM